MASHPATTSTNGNLDLSRWRKAPVFAIAAGVVFLILGALVARNSDVGLARQFGFSWLLGFMFFLSLCLGGMFLVLAHHLFDASWSVPIRRYCEHLACLALPLLFLFIPVALLAPKLYGWMTMDPPDHALHAKHALLNQPFWHIRWVVYFVIWIALAYGLRRFSVAQDKDGAAVWTFRMRLLSYIGIFLFAITLTFAAIDWMKSLQHQWFSTMYGVYYFAGSVWTTIATVYVIAVIMRRTGTLRDVLYPTHFYYIGALLLAFTVFYAYIHFSQYFIIWNANLPEETFWYRLREQGSWWWVGMVIIFGHFFVPFLSLLRIDFKLKIAVMGPLAIWAWLMHFFDLSYNIMPVAHPKGFILHWMDIGAFLVIGGICAAWWLKSLGTTAPYPVRDPRLKESLTSHELPPGEADAGLAH
jgi:hypothetical protein